MLKIRDDIDLKELKRFGFKKQPKYAYGYYFKYFLDGTRIAICKNRDGFREKEIYLDALERKLKDSINNYSETIFDLISAGFVEKVSEEKKENETNYCCGQCIKYFNEVKTDE